VGLPWGGSTTKHLHRTFLNSQFHGTSLTNKNAMRELKYHEKKLLKKVDFLKWKSDQSLKINQILSKYGIQRRDDYIKYNQLAGQITKLTNRLVKLPPTDPYRIKVTEQLVAKLYGMGVIHTKSLNNCAKLSTSAFCRRRLSVVLVRLQMAANMKESITLIEQGHVRVGPEIVNDPAFLVTRTLEDFVTWADKSKIRRHIMKYNDKLDDYDLLGN
jgi:U3 small nucleolar ribonucleoprotein protein IMP3